jgi:hypothetical protein
MQMPYPNPRRISWAKLSCKTTKLSSDDEDLALKFVESFSIDMTNLFADVTDIEVLV